MFDALESESLEVFIYPSSLIDTYDALEMQSLEVSVSPSSRDVVPRSMLFPARL